MAGDETKIQIVPLGAGLKYVQNISRHFDFYLGLGVLASYVHIHDDAPYVIQRSNKWIPGGVVKIGSFITFFQNVFIDLAIDYSYMKIDFSDPGGETLTRDSAHLSGFTFGGGIGYRF